jgi:protein O-GlcNAc transferase
MCSPFPFDGSRTAFESLVAGVPLVTLPSDMLRGRMGQAFLRTMGIPELSARNFSEYIAICLKLYRNSTFFLDTRQKVRDRVYLIWEDLEVAHSWVRFVSRVVGTDIPAWDTFALSSGRDVGRETALRELRRGNRLYFDGINE